MTKLVLHGELGKKFGREYNLQIKSPADAIRALSAMKPGFKEDFARGNYYIYTSMNGKKTYLDEQSIRLSTNATINIVPAVEGAKKKGVGKMLAGIALIGVAFIPGLNAAVFGSISGLASAAGTPGVIAAKMLANVTARALFMGGLTMAMGGAAQLMAPKVGESKESTLFQGAPDSVQEGTPVPLVYGTKYLALGYPVSFELTNGLNSYSGGSGTTGGGPGGGGSSGSTGGWETY